MKKALPQKHYRKTLSTSLTELRVVINYQPHEGGSTRLSGYAVDAKTGLKILSCKSRQRIAKSDAQITMEEHIVIERITVDYLAMQPHKALATSVNHPYTEAFVTLTKEQKRALCPDTWQAATTRKQGLAYFSTTFLPLLDLCGLDPSAQDLQNIVTALGRKSADSKNSSGKPSDAAKMVMRHVYDCSRMYSKLRALADVELPDLLLPQVKGGRQGQAEQCKALTDAIRIRVAALLQRLVSNGLSMGGVIMLTGMTRTAEACAPKYGDILLCGDYAVYGVIWQAQNGVRIADLKTNSSYRLIILPKYAVDALLSRKAYLQNQGYSETAIQQMYVVSKPDNPKVMANPSDLSTFVRKLLSLAGCNHAFWSAADNLMLDEPDLDPNNNPESDVCAYVLRRNACTMFCNVCGMLPDMVDALMGHKLSCKCQTDWYAYLRRPDNWPKVAAQMERVIYDPAHSANPAFRPIALHTGMKMDLDEGQCAFKLIVGEESVHLLCQLETLECGDTITILTNAASKIGANINPLSVDDSTAPPIGMLQSEEFYQQYIAQAQEIDISGLSP